MKCIVFYLQFINSLEGLGMFFYSAALIRRLRRFGFARSNELYFPMIFLHMNLIERLRYRCFSKEVYWFQSGQIHSSDYSLCQVWKIISYVTYMGRGDQAHGVRPHLFLTYVSSLRPSIVK